MIANLRSSLQRMSQPLLLGLGFAVLVAINAASLWLVVRAQSDYGQVSHTLEVEKQLANLLLALRRAESAQRGYLLTQAPEYLADYEEAAMSVPRLLADIRNNTADNPAQQKSVAELQVSVQARLDRLAANVRALNERGPDAALAAMRDGAERLDIEIARSIVERMMEEEATLLRQRASMTDSTTFNLFAVSLVGSLLIVALGLAALLLVRKSNRERDEAQRRMQDANIDLEATVAERTSELEEANQELQRYAYIVSHDLRSPLVNIMGFTAELENLREDIFTELAARTRTEGEPAQPDDELKQSYNEALGFIKASITKMDGLIHAILRLSREGQRRFQPERIDMAALIGTVSGSIAHQTEEAGATIEVDALPEIVSDRLAVEQIFSNLLDNAVKYLDRGKPGRIVVRGRPVLSHVVYEIEDNGRGIPEKDHRRIFELFRRSGAQNRPGEGIGLAHVRTLVRRLGGRISVKSEAGEGSTFIVTLPQRWSSANERSTA